MAKISITYRSPTTGLIQTPHRYRDGFFRVGKPSNGKVRHHKTFETRIGTLDEVLAHIRQGHLVRMSAAHGGSPGLIRRLSLDVLVDGVRI